MITTSKKIVLTKIDYIKYCPGHNFLCLQVTPNFSKYRIIEFMNKLMDKLTNNEKMFT